MARTTVPSSVPKIVRRSIVFTRELRDGKYVYIREPYDLIEIDRAAQGYTKGNETFFVSNQARQTSVGVNVGTDSTTDSEQFYDNIEIFDKPFNGLPNR